MACQKWRRSIVSGAALLVTIAPASLRAQPNSSSILDSLSTISTDTGDFAPGRRDFSNYSVLECVAAAINTRAIVQRTISSQINALELRKNLLTDTLPAQEVAVARACGARFTVAATPARSLNDLLALALLANDDSLALAAVQRMRTLASPALRDSVVTMSVLAMLKAEPARVAMAETLIADMTTAKTPVSRWWILAHTALLEAYAGGKDRRRAQREIAEVVRLSQRLVQQKNTPATDTTYWSSIKSLMVQGYAKLATVTFLEHPDSVIPLATTAKEHLATIPWGRESDREMAQLTPRELVERWLLPFMQQTWEVLGKPYPANDATYWFPRRPDTMGTQPVTLYVSSDAFLKGFLIEGLERTGCSRLQQILTCEANDGNLQNRLRTWTSQYADRGLRVVVTGRTLGEVFQSLTLTPAQEAERFRWFYQDYLKVPVTIAVSVSPVQHESSGVLTYRFTDNARLLYGAPLVLVGRHGELIYRGDDGAPFDALLQRVVSPTYQLRDIP